MGYTENEVFEFIKENDVKFIKLMFCDLFGHLKTVSIMPEEISRAFDSGISFDATGIPGFTNTVESDLFLKPDVSTMTILPWRPQQGRVLRFYANVYHPDGTPCIGGTRQILLHTEEKLKSLGYSCRVGTECEFYLFKNDENGFPTRIPHDNAGYCDAAPLDKGENVRREICLTLEQMKIRPETSHHESGPGQHEIDFRHAPVLEAADNLATFKNVVKIIAAKNGLYASFMPKPLDGSEVAHKIKAAGSGLHINISLYKIGKDMLALDSWESKSFIAGILTHINEMTAFLNPNSNSYERLGCFEAPRFISWSQQNRSQLIRIPAAKDEYIRFELRSPDPSCSQYLALALILEAGLDGIAHKMELQPAINRNLFATDTDTSNLETLPQNLKEALKIAEKSEFLASVLPKELISLYLNAKRNYPEEAFEVL
jgi:glutamine synthetase